MARIHHMSVGLHHKLAALSHKRSELSLSGPDGAKKQMCSLSLGDGQIRLVCFVGLRANKERAAGRTASGIHVVDTNNN